MPVDYNQTLNLPSTEFPMRANLPQREPAMLEQWEKERLYYKMIESNEGKPLYVFHDGPPYANADIHLGTALNKILKDVIVRHKNISGYKCQYVPGWDTHGLPIELKAMKEIGLKEALDPVKLRKHCREFALYHVENQKKQFKRLGTLAHYDDPYLTLAPEYEALQIEIFGAMAEKGYIYKDLKSVYWCPECVTALAEAEIEYAEDPCDSVYVKFPVKEDKNGILPKLGVQDIGSASVVIWTTTTWTLPANLAICLGPAFEYAAVRVGDECLILAKELLGATMEAAGLKEGDYQLLGSVKGSELEYLVCKHPFLERDSLVVVGDHVTLESGTGCVHTAPGHGVEDFELIAKHYPHVGCIVPVDEHGKMTAEAGEFVEGLPTIKANKVIFDRLKADGSLFATRHIVHQYPHCWRCKDPVLFRATEQWFCNVDDFKQETVAEISKVNFIPEWGKGRMQGMVEDRSAWCLSRQRTWGVPIPAFYCKACEKYIINADTTKATADLFRNEGSDTWYLKPAEEILPAGFTCPHCGGTGFTKETDIMDVWFDSGVSHAATLQGRWPDQAWPCDLYLEGTDQYRGWFQSSLLTAVAWKGKAPYKTVCTHGWVVDGEGRKMSKSLGNGITPDEIIKDFGADILRLWVVSSDYHADIRISKEILKQLSEIYRKIRNTARYILGNLDGFDPDRDSVADSDLTDLDKWALAKLDALLERTDRAYEKFDFHIIFHALHNFCTIDMSNFYLDVIKDRLYVNKADDPARRAAQTTIYRILRALTTAVAPIIPFTAEEIWSHIPASKGYNQASVMFNELPKPAPSVDAAFMARWDQIIAVRNDANKALELARAEKRIGKSLEAKVVLYAGGQLLDFLKANEGELSAAFIVSQVEIKEGEGPVKGEVEGLSLEVLPADGEKCERCWVFSDTVGGHAAHKTLCARCAGIIEG